MATSPSCQHRPSAAATNLLAVPLLTTTHQTPISQPLRHCIDHVFGEPVKLYARDLAKLDELRLAALDLPVNLTLTHLENQLRYYAQLATVCTKFPDDLQPMPTWHGTDLGSTVPVLPSGLRCEQACLLFNVAASYSHLALAENRVTAAGLRDACGYFQRAAGIFQHLAEHYCPRLTGQFPSELTPSVLNSLCALMLAQAQECCWQKAVSDCKSNSLVAKLARQVSLYYEQASNSIQQRLATDHHLPKAWQCQLALKRTHFDAAAHYRQSKHCLSLNRCGEEIGRLRQAQQAVHAVQSAWSSAIQGSGLSRVWDTVCHTLQDLQSLQRSILLNLQRAEKDNSFVYRATVPEAAALSPIPAASMVNAHVPSQVTQPPSLLSPTTNPPLLAGLLPFAIHQGVALYHDRKSQRIKETIVAPLQDLVTQLQTSVRAMGWADFIPPLVASGQLPMLIERGSQEIKACGGCNRLEQLQKTLCDQAQACVATLAAIERTRPTSNTSVIETVPGSSCSPAVPNPWRTAIQTYQSCLHQAQVHDQGLAKTFNNWRPFISLLEGARNQLMAAIPVVIVSSLGLTEQAILNGLRQVLQEADHWCDQLHQVQSEADQLSRQDDIGSFLTQTYQRQTSEHPNLAWRITPAAFEETLTEQLAKYQPFQQRVQQAHQELAQWQQQLTAHHRQYQQLCQTNPLIHQRTKAFGNLSTAIQRYKELLRRAQQGVQFYESVLIELQTLRDKSDP
ncbi:pH-response regulator protein palA/rim20 [Dimargaris verticillata]|uniref:PH-response regulator protein palA/rim20 n=1 Tax=Dimargaris verticillata TaxID=2761393 RepID=A0A9W8B2T0_9FUNG|nr:pH-response regulator protein palA/rim20 [Dimargaris verticillata]